MEKNVRRKKSVEDRRQGEKMKEETEVKGNMRFIGQLVEESQV